MGVPPRTVLNPSTGKDSHMRRNKKGSRWVSDKTEHSGDRNKGTGKNVSFQERRNSFDNNDLDVSDDGTTSDASSEPPPILEAAIYNSEDLKDMPDTYVRLPSVRSWSSLRGSIDDDYVSPRTTTYSGKNDIRSPVSPVNYDLVAGSNSPIEPTEFAATAEEKKASDGAIFHSLSVSVKKPASKTKKVHGESDLAVFYRTARSIYNVGPKGEGQKLWSGYKRFQKGQKQHAEVDQQVPDHAAAPRRPSAPGLSAYPPTRPAPPNTDIPIRQAVPLTERLYPRKKSQVSMTSCEVPIQIGPDVKLVDRSRPLPPVPQLPVAPKTRQHGHGLAGTWKPLPSSPRPRAVREVEATQNNANRPLPPIPRAPSMR
ncbi:hypothetical protein BDU57DRAFT_533889 [Ampelomyces quisqualis]|uniref:Uncharacterized protein n=1 Tax=Ampelomyces quisqualis TaxID=50730 RepID=A0A6A5QXB0_AMPQU|nr:hypothetical protein BDU57DRAFT_533889 [Ampelomyces quisqualis]